MLINELKSRDRFALIRKLLIMFGIGMVALSGTVFCLAISGVFQTERLAIAGNSGLKTIAFIAVLGCLLAAVGYWDDYERDE
jgi:hypothetical protein